MNLLIPMAGAGKRFADEGYKLAKPLIPVSGKPMIIQAIESLPKAQKQVLVCRSEHLTEAKIDQVIQKDYPNAHFVSINYLTQGQAETCLLAEAKIPQDEPLMIGACDHGHHWNQEKFNELINDHSIDAVIWTFRNYAPVERNPQMYGWVKVDHNNQVIEVSCKKAISHHPSHDHAITGAFWFRKAKQFFKYTKQMIEKNIRINNEFYVDVVFNEMVEAGLKVKVFEVDKYLCWGTPADLKTYQYWEKYFAKLSLIIPCYNENKNLPLIFQKLEKFKNNSQVEIILVNNGSTDHSAAAFKELLVNTPFKLVTVPVNQGYGYGILEGLKAATGTHLGWTHADMQTDPQDAWTAFEKSVEESIPLVKEHRKNHNFFNNFFTFGIELFAWAMLNTWLSDINAQPKIFERRLYRALKNPPDDFSLDLFLMLSAKRLNLPVKTIPVYFGKRLHGEAKGGGSLKTKFKLIARTIKFILNTRA
jgi:dTDP-glucose pyrophosphorylase